MDSSFEWAKWSALWLLTVIFLCRFMKLAGSRYCQECDAELFAATDGWTCERCGVQSVAPQYTRSPAYRPQPGYAGSATGVFAPRSVPVRSRAR